MNFEFDVSDVLLTFLIYQTRKKKKELKKGRVSFSSLWGGMVNGHTASIDKQTLLVLGSLSLYLLQNTSCGAMLPTFRVDGMELRGLAQVTKAGKAHALSH